MKVLLDPATQRFFLSGLLMARAVLAIGLAADSEAVTQSALVVLEALVVVIAALIAFSMAIGGLK